MKKCILLLLILILTGCSVVRIDTNSLDNIVDVVLSKNNTLYNKDGQGYKYYIPNGVTHIDTDDLSHTLYYKGEYLYLYVDIVSYYYKNKIEYKKNDYAYFSKKINRNDKTGYVEVIKKIIDEGIKNGEIKKCNSKFMAYTVFSLTSSIMIYKKQTNKAYSLSELYKECESTIFGGNWLNM